MYDGLDSGVKYPCHSPNFDRYVTEAVVCSLVHGGADLFCPSCRRCVCVTSGYTRLDDRYKREREKGVEIEIKEAMSEKGTIVMGVMTDNMPQVDIKEACRLYGGEASLYQFEHERMETR